MGEKGDGEVSVFRGGRRPGLLMVLAVVALTLVTVPKAVFAEPEDVIDVPAEGLAINNGIVYGISEDWYEAQLDGAETGNLRLRVSIPSEIGDSPIVGLANNSMRSSSTYSPDRDRYGAVNYFSNPGWNYEIVEIDFTNASNLESIGEQAVMGVSLSGEVDLSNTEVTRIEKSAFSGCKGITGVVLPTGLVSLGSSSSGSVFSGCGGLEYIRVAGGDPTATFELPDGLEVIGRQTFRDCFAPDVEARVVIPESVEVIGSEAFYSSRVKQIVVRRQSDGWDSNYIGYDSGAFKTGASGLLVIFPDNKSYLGYSLSAGSIVSAVKRAMACPMELSFNDGDQVVRAEDKLRYQSIRYVPIDGTPFWELDEDYELPAAGESGLEDRPGYKITWSLGSEGLTTSSILDTNVTEPVAKVGYVFMDPEVAFSVDGVAQEGNDLVVPYDGVTAHSAGVKVTHPLTMDADGDDDEYVYFKYCWWDERDNGVNGPRSMEEPDIFSTADGTGKYGRVKTSSPEIPITSLDHARTDGDRYMVEIYGYHVVNGTESLFYKSHHNFIDFGQDSDTEATTSTSYVFNVSLDDIGSRVITVRPADLTVYIGGGAYGGVVDGSGEYVEKASGLPEPGFTVDLPDSLDGVDPTDLIFKVGAGAGTWGLEPYDGNADTAVYRLVPKGGQGPARVVYTSTDGEAVAADGFDPGETLNQTLEVSLYRESGAGAAGDAVVEYGGTTYPVDVSGTAELTVRGTTEDADLARPGQSAGDGEPGLTVPEGACYTINGGRVGVRDPGDVALLFDRVIDGDDLGRTSALDERVDETLGTGWSTEYRYLDLVDTGNGNAWVAADKPVTISWPVPEGIDPGEVEFKVLHFAGVNRSLGPDEVLSAIEGCDVEQLDASVVGNHVTFEVGESGFSPFVLAWHEKGDSTTPGGGSVPPAVDPNPAEPEPVTSVPGLEIRKTLKGRDIVPGEFAFAVTATEAGAGGVAPSSVVGTVRADGRVSFRDGFTFCEEGDYAFTVSEILPADDDATRDGIQSDGVTYDETTYTVRARVAEGSDGSLAVTWEGPSGALGFENRYEPSGSASVSFAARKVLTGRDLAAGEFVFELAGSDGTVLRIATNDAEGNVAFDGPIEFTEPGTYAYIVREVAGSAEGITYDGTTHRAVVVVTRGDDGALTASISYDGSDELPLFVNSYEPTEGSMRPGESGGAGGPARPALPETGDRVNPAVPVTLAVCGVMLVTLGAILKRRQVLTK